MVRKRRRTYRRKRKSRQLRRVSNAPPRLSITSNTRRINIAYGIDINSVNAKRIDITYFDIFKYPPNAGLSYQYHQAKITGVKIYWQSDSATSDTGSVCLNVEDYGENNGTDTCDFHELLAYPGSVVRKVWQNVSNRWFPTNPSGRQFRNVERKAGILTITLRHSIIGSSLKGRLLCTIMATMRGRSIERCNSAAKLLDKIIMTEHMDMVNIQPSSK